MNKIYKLKFDRKLQQLIVVSELATGAGKEKTVGGALSGALHTSLQALKLLSSKLTPLALSLSLAALPAVSYAADLPTGGQIVGGTGQITSTGNQMIISQQSQKLAANWQSFDIGQNHSVQFVQPNSSAIALNRVTGQSASQIMGQLNANGRVFLINPNGVMVGKGAQVNTAGFLASTKNLSVTDFMQGNYRLKGGSAANAEIINQGSLTTTKGGFIVLAADKVRNEGTISTPGGKTVLAAADQVTLTLDTSGLTGVSVSGNVVNALVENKGLISARDGKVYLTARGQDMLVKTVVNNTGIIDASSMTAENGVIRLGTDSGSALANNTSDNSATTSAVANNTSGGASTSALATNTNKNSGTTRTAANNTSKTAGTMANNPSSTSPSHASTTGSTAANNTSKINTARQPASGTTNTAVNTPSKTAGSVANNSSPTNTASSTSTPSNALAKNTDGNNAAPGSTSGNGAATNTAVNTPSKTVGSVANNSSPANTASSTSTTTSALAKNTDSNSAAASAAAGTANATPSALAKNTDDNRAVPGSTSGNGGATNTAVNTPVKTAGSVANNSSPANTASSISTPSSALANNTDSNSTTTSAAAGTASATPSKTAGTAANNTSPTNTASSTSTTSSALANNTDGNSAAADGTNGNGGTVNTAVNNASKTVGSVANNSSPASTASSTSTTTSALAKNTDGNNAAASAGAGTASATTSALANNTDSNSAVVDTSTNPNTNGIAVQGGEIHIDGGGSGVVSQSGSVLANSDSGKGGNIVIEGQLIHLAGGSRTEATGATGGGSVLVGGGWQGKDSRIKNADKLVMDSGAVIDVSATLQGNGDTVLQGNGGSALQGNSGTTVRGNGGTAVLWSERYTNFQGNIKAQGGAAGGNGGQVETSSQGNLQAFGSVSTSAPQGKGGAWLLDPTDVEIVSGTTDTSVSTASPFTPTASGAKIGAESIQNALNSGDVTVKTSGTDTAGQLGNITVSANITNSAALGRSLTLWADKDINFADRVKIESTNNLLNFNLFAGANSNISLGAFVTFNLHGGDFYAGAEGRVGKGVTFKTSNNGNINAHDIWMDTAIENHFLSMTASNNLSINGKFTTYAGYTGTAIYSAGNKLKINAGSEDFTTSNIDANPGGFVELKGGTGGVEINARNITMSSPDKTTTNISKITSGAGVTLNANTVSLDKINITAAGNIVFTAKTQTVNLTSSDLTGANINAIGINNGNDQIPWQQTDTSLTATTGSITINNKPNTTTYINTGAGKRGYSLLGARFNANNVITAENANINITFISNADRVSGGKIEHGISIADGNTFSAKNITLDGTTIGPSSGTGLLISSSSGDKQVTIKATEKVTLNGVGNAQYTSVDPGYYTCTNCAVDGITINNASISAGTFLNITAMSNQINAGLSSGQLGTGLIINNATLGATRANVHGYNQGAYIGGDNRGRALGFTLENIHWTGELAKDISRLTLSSQSGAEKFSYNMRPNKIGANVFDYDQYEKVLQNGIENDTYLVLKELMPKAGSGEWKRNYTSGGPLKHNYNARLDTGKWIVRNEKKENYNGDIDVKGLVFQNVTLSNDGNISVGNGIVENKSAFTAAKNATITSLTVNNSQIKGVDITSSGSRISASTLTATHDIINRNSTISGSTLTATHDITDTSSTITSSTFKAGNNISTANSTFTSSTVTAANEITANDVIVSAGTITATNGNISFGGTKYVKLQNGVAVTAGKDINVDINQVPDNGAAFIVSGNSMLKAAEEGNISINVSGNKTSGGDSPTFYANGANFKAKKIDVNLTVNGTAAGAMQIRNGTTNFDGNLSLKASLGTGFRAFANNNDAIGGVPNLISISEGASLNINGTGDNNITASTRQGHAVLVRGAINTKGNLRINGTSTAGEGVRLYNNSAVTAVPATMGATPSAAIILEGHSTTGTGVNLTSSKPLTNAAVNGFVDGSGTAVKVQQTLNNVTLKGDASKATSPVARTGTGTGVQLAGNAILQNNTHIKGESDSGTGVDINGATATLMGGGQGVQGDKTSVITGTINGASGIGVRLRNSVHGGAKGAGDDEIMKIHGIAKGNGEGVRLENTISLTNVSLDGVASGSGYAVNVSGSPTLNNANISGTKDGTATSGGALRIGGTGTLISDANSHITGTIKSADNTAAAVTVADSVQVNNANISGTATKGSGIDLNGSNVQVNNTDLKGDSTSGAGIHTAGTVTLASGSARTFIGTSGSGTGISTSGTLTSDDNITLKGTATQTGGTGVKLAGTVNRGKIVGTALDTAGVEIAQNTVINRGTIDGNTTGTTTTSSTAATSVGVKLLGNNTLNSVLLNGTSEGGTGVKIEAAASPHNLLKGSKDTIIKGYTNSNSGTGVELLTNVRGDTPDGTGESHIMTIIGEAKNPTHGTGLIVNIADPVTPESLVNVSLQGLAHGNGNAVQVKSSATLGSASTITGTNDAVKDDAKGITGGNGVLIDGDGKQITVTGGTITGSSKEKDGVQLANNASLGDATNNIRTTVTGTSSNGTGVSATGHNNLTNADITGTSASATGVSLANGGTLTNTNITGNSTSGTGVSVADSGALTNSNISGNSSSATGVSLVNSGKLTSTHIKGNTSGSTDSAIGVSVSGTDLTSDKASTLIGTAHKNSSATAPARNSGIGVKLNANISVTPAGTTYADAMHITGSTEGSGEGVQLAKSNIQLKGVFVGGYVTGTGGGTGVNIIDGAKLADNTQISAGDDGTDGAHKGTALKLSGTVAGETDGTGQRGKIDDIHSSHGTAIELADNVKVKDLLLNATTSDGTAVHFLGNATLDNTPVKGLAGTPGAGKNSYGVITESGTLKMTGANKLIEGSGDEERATALLVKGTHIENLDTTPALLQGNAIGWTNGVHFTGDTTLTGITASGTTELGKAVYNTGNLTLADGKAISDTEKVHSSLSGTVVKRGGSIDASGRYTGDAVVLEGNVSGAGKNTKISGSADAGTGISVAKGITLANLKAEGSADSNIGVALNGHNTLTNVELVGRSTSSSGVKIAAVDSPTGDNVLHGTKQTTITGITNGSGKGVELLTNVNGDAKTGTEIMHITGKAEGNQGGTGLVVNIAKPFARALINVSLGGESDGSGDATQLNNSLTLNKDNEIKGSNTGTGNGIVIDGGTATGGGKAPINITGGTLTGTSKAKAGVQLADKASLGNKSILDDKGHPLKTTVSGTSGSGTGVALNGNNSLTNAEISGTSSSGIAVNLSSTAMPGSSAPLTNSHISGTTNTGTAVLVGGTTTLQGDKDSSLSGTVKKAKRDDSSEIPGSDTGTGVNLMVDVHGGAADTTASPVKKMHISGSTSGSGDAIKLSKANMMLTNTSLEGTVNGTGGGTAINISNGANLVSTDIKGKDSGSSAGGAGVKISGTVENSVASGFPSGTKIDPITGESTKGDGIQLADNATVNNSALHGSTSDGAGVHFLGNATLHNAPVTGNSNGTGTAVAADNNGTPTDGTTGAHMTSTLTITGDTDADKTLTGTATANGGTAVSLTNVNASGIRIIANADKNPAAPDSHFSATGAHFSGSNVLTNVQTIAKTDTGTALISEGSLTLKDDGTQISTLQGSASGDEGTGVLLKGTVNGTNKTTISGTATSGSGVKLKNATVTNGSITGTATDAITGRIPRNAAVDISDSTVTDVTLTGTGTGDAQGVQFTNENHLKGVTTIAKAENGTAFRMENGDLYLEEGASGTHSTVTAKVEKADATGDAIVIGGCVTGTDKTNSTLTGTATHGNGVFLSSSMLENLTISGNSDSGIGVRLGNETLNHVTVKGDSKQHIGVQIYGSVSPNPDDNVLKGTKDTSITGTTHADDGKGVVLAANVNGGATSGSGDSLQIMKITGEAKGTTNGVGLVVDIVNQQIAPNHPLVNVSLNGLAHGKGDAVQINSDLSSNSLTSITGTNDGTGDKSGNGVVIDGKGKAITVAGGSITGTSKGKTGVQLADNASLGETTKSGVTPARTTVTGSSTDGIGVSASGHNQLANTDITGNSTSNTGVSFASSGSLSNSNITGNTHGTKEGIAAVIVSGTETLRGDKDSNITGTAYKDSAVTDTSLKNSATGVILNSDIDAHPAGSAPTEKMHVTGNTDGNGDGVLLKKSNIALTDVIVNGCITGTGGGTAVTIADGAKLNNTDVTGSDKGTTTAGIGVKASGVITIDSGKTPGTLTGDSTKGDGVQLADNSEVHHIAVTGSSSDGTGVHFKGSATLDNAPVTGTGSGAGATGIATEGGTLTVSGDTDEKKTLTGIASGDKGTAVAVKGTNISDAIINAKATNTATGAHFSGDSTLKHVKTTASAENGSAVTVNGNLSLADNDTDGHSGIDATSTGSGDAVSVTGKITGADKDHSSVTGKSNSGKGLVLAKDGTLENLTVTANSTSSTGAELSGHNTLNNVSLTGESQQKTGVLIAATSDTDAKENNVLRGTKDTHITGITHGTKGDGKGVELLTNVNGGEKGDKTDTDPGIMTITGKASDHKDGTGLVVNIVKPLADPDKALVNVSLGGESDGSGDATQVNSSLTLNEHSSISGKNTGTDTATDKNSGRGLVIDGNGNKITLQGGKLSGSSASKDGVTLADKASLTDTSVTGTSGSGTGVNVAGNNTLTNVKDLQGTSTSGTGVHLDSSATLTKTTVNGSTDSGTAVLVDGSTTLQGDRQSSISGSAKKDGGTGVNLAADVHGGAADPTADPAKMKITGSTEANGDAIKLSKTGITLTNTSLAGTVTNAKDGTGGGGGTAVNITSGAKLVSTDISGKDTGSVTGGSGVKISGKVESSIATDPATSSPISTTTDPITGESTKGDGISLADNSEVKNSALHGNTTDGTGVHFHGNAKLHNAPVTGNSKGTGTAVAADGAPITESAGVTSGGSTLTITGDTAADKTISGTASADGGSGVRLSNTSTSDTAISGTATTGEGVKLDKATVTSGSITGSASKAGGKAMTITGSTISDAPLTATATGAADGMHLSGENHLKGVTSTASSDTGTAFSSEGDLHLEDGTGGKHSTVTATATGENADAVVLKGKVANANADTSIHGTATSGSAVKLDSAEVTNGSLTGSASKAGGKAMTIMGSTISDATLQGTATGAADGMHLSGENHLKGVETTASSDTGTAFSSDGTLHLEDNTSGDKHSTVTATATGENADAVALSGSVTGADKANSSISGTATSGKGVQVAKDTVLTTLKVDGHSTSNTGVELNGHNTLNSVTVSGDSQQKTGVKINATNPDTAVDPADHNVLSGTSDTSITGTTHGAGESAKGVELLTNVNGGAKTADAMMTITGKAVDSTDKDSTGLLVDIVTPLPDGKKSLVNVSLHGSAKGDGTGAKLAGTVSGSGADSATVSGDSESGTGVKLASATVSSLSVDGTTDSGSGVEFSGDNHLTSTPVKGTSKTSGSGVKTDTGSTLTADKGGSRITAKTTGDSGTAAHLSGVLTSVDVKVADDSKGGAGNTGIKLEKATINSSTLTTSTADGKALEVADGSSSLDKDSSVTTGSTGSGTGLEVAKGGTLNLAAGTTLASDATSSDGTGILIAGTVTGAGTGADNSKLTSNSKNGGTAVKVAAGGTLDNISVEAKTKGTQDSDRAIVFKGSTPATVTHVNNSHIDAKVTNGAGNGKGSAIEIAADADIASDATSVMNGSAESGAGAIVGGKVNGAQINGKSASNVGLSLTDGVELSNGMHSGTSNSPDKAGAEIKGNSTLVNTTINGLNTHGGPSVLIDTGSTGKMKLDGDSVVNGGEGLDERGNPIKGSGIGVSVLGTIEGTSEEAGKVGHINGHSTAGDGVKIDLAAGTEKTTLNKISVDGSSGAKAGVNIAAKTTLSGGSSVTGHNEGSGGSAVAINADVLSTDNEPIDRNTPPAPKNLIKGETSANGVGGIVVNSGTVTNLQLIGSAVDRAGVQSNASPALFTDSLVKGTSKTDDGVNFAHPATLVHTIVEGLSEATTADKGGVHFTEDATLQDGSSVIGSNSGTGAGKGAGVIAEKNIAGSGTGPNKIKGDTSGGSGDAVALKGSMVDHVEVSGTAGNGHAVEVSNPGNTPVTFTNTKVEGTSSGSDSAVHLAVNTTLNDSTVDGKNIGTGAGASVDGDLSGSGTSSVSGSTTVTTTGPDGTPVTTHGSGNGLEVNSGSVSHVDLLGDSTSGEGAKFSKEVTISESTVTGKTASDNSEHSGVHFVEKTTLGTDTHIEGSNTGAGPAVTFDKDLIGSSPDTSTVSGDTSGGSGSASAVAIKGSNVEHVAVSGTAGDGHAVEVSNPSHSPVTFTDSKVQGTSSGDSNSAVHLAEDTTLKDGSAISGTNTGAGTGAGVTVDKKLSGTGTGTNTVEGNATDGHGDGLVINSSAIDHVTVDGKSTGGEGAKFTKAVTINESTVKGKTASDNPDHSGVHFTENTTLGTDTHIEGSNTGAGPAVTFDKDLAGSSPDTSTVSGDTTGGSGSAVAIKGSNVEHVAVSGTAGDGHAVEVSNPSHSPVTFTNTKVKGTSSGSDSAVHLAEDTTLNDSSVEGNNIGSGTGTSVDGDLSGSGSSSVSGGTTATTTGPDGKPVTTHGSGNGLEVNSSSVSHVDLLGDSTSSEGAKFTKAVTISESRVKGKTTSDNPDHSGVHFLENTTLGDNTHIEGSNSGPGAAVTFDKDLAGKGADTSTVSADTSGGSGDAAVFHGSKVDKVAVDSKAKDGEGARFTREVTISDSTLKAKTESDKPEHSAVHFVEKATLVNSSVDGKNAGSGEGVSADSDLDLNKAKVKGEGEQNSAVHVLGDVDMKEKSTVHAITNGGNQPALHIGGNVLGDDGEPEEKQPDPDSEAFNKFIAFISGGGGNTPAIQIDGMDITNIGAFIGRINDGPGDAGPAILLTNPAQNLRNTVLDGKSPTSSEDVHSSATSPAAVVKPENKVFIFGKNNLQADSTPQPTPPAPPAPLPAPDPAPLPAPAPLPILPVDPLPPAVDASDIDIHSAMESVQYLKAMLEKSGDDFSIISQQWKTNNHFKDKSDMVELRLCTGISSDSCYSVFMDNRAPIWKVIYQKQ